MRLGERMILDKYEDMPKDLKEAAIEKIIAEEDIDKGVEKSRSVIETATHNLDNILKNYENDNAINKNMLKDIRNSIL